MASLSLALLEVLDKQLPVAAAFAWAGLGGVAGFFGGRRFGWRVAAPVLVGITALALYLLAQFTDRFVGPATMAETGRWYPVLSGILITAAVSASIWGARDHSRRANALKARGGERAV